MIGQCQITESKGDYIVECWMQFPGQAWPHWKPLINFGERQGDAKIFMLVDFKDLKGDRVYAMARNYDGRRKKRIANGRYMPTKEDEQ